MRLLHNWYRGNPQANKGTVLLHKKRLSVESYEEYYETKLKSQVTKQYEVDGLKGVCNLFSL
jgi:hypothetical protein